MDDRFCLWALYSICIDVGHDIMAYCFFALFCHIIIDIVLKSFQLFDLLICDIEPQLFLCLGKRDPELPPCAEFHIR